MSWKSPVVMIGLDSITWDVMDPLLAAGKMPNIARLMSEGSSSALQSMIRYPSPALWTSIITGKLPEKHGVPDFYSATRLHIQVPTLYEILPEEPGSNGLFRWHASGPHPEKTKFTVPSYVDRWSDTFPQKLEFLNDLARPTGVKSYLNGAYQLLRHGARFSTIMNSLAEVIYEAATRPEQEEWWYRRRFVEAAINTDVFSHLLRDTQPQFSAVLYSYLDDLSHHYWKYHEPEAFDDVTKEEIEKYGEVINNAYIKADHAVGQILKSVPEDALVIVLSDHGQHAIKLYQKPAMIHSQKLLKFIGFQDRIWSTELGLSILLRAHDTSDRQTLNELKMAIEQITMPEDGQAVFEVEQDEAATHLVVKVNIPKETPLTSKASFPNGRIIQLQEFLYSRGKLSGHHSEWGVLIMKGPGVRKGHKIEEKETPQSPHILDVTPTILALRGLPIGRDMDGKVLEQLIEPSFLEKNPYRYIDSYKKDAIASDQQHPDHAVEPLTAQELKELEGKLRDLGYLS
ncbi:MAG: alkaline phosphatase family protein [Ardenticatenaceae bacterium]